MVKEYFDINDSTNFFFYNRLKNIKLTLICIFSKDIGKICLQYSIKIKFY